MKAKIDRISEFYKLSVDMDLFSRKTELIWWDELDYKGFNELDIHNCYSLKDKWPPDMCCFVTGEKPVDFTYFGPHLKIVSDQARKTIKNILLMTQNFYQ